MSADSCEVVITREGAPAMLDRRVGEVMHPVVGPAIEAARLAAGGEEPLVLLDVGLGAASNAIAAWQVSEALPATARPLTIVSFERSLDALALALRPEHAESFGLAGRAGEAARALLGRGEHATARTRWRASARTRRTWCFGIPTRRGKTRRCGRWPRSRRCGAAAGSG